MSAPDTSNNLLQGENTIEMRTKQNARSFLEGFFSAASKLACLYGLLWVGNKTLLFSKTSERRSEPGGSASSPTAAA